MKSTTTSPADLLDIDAIAARLVRRELPFAVAVRIAAAGNGLRLADLSKRAGFSKNALGSALARSLPGVEEGVGQLIGYGPDATRAKKVEKVLDNPSEGR
jgi:lambda repressor-like predicted transcriptional regulator